MRKIDRSKLGLIMLTFFLLGIISPVAPAKANVVDSYQFQPVLSLEVKNGDEVMAGGEFFLTLVIRNFSNNPAFDVGIELKVLDQQNKPAATLEPFSFKNKDDKSLVLEKFEGNETRTLTIPLLVANDAIQRDYRLQVNLAGKNALFEDSVRSSTTVVVPVGYGNLKPQVLVRQVSFNPAEPDLTEPFALIFSLENKSQVDVRNLTVEFDGLNNFQVTELSNKFRLNAIAAGKISGPVQFAVKPKETRQDNQVKVSLTYDYQGNKTETIIETLNLPLPEVQGAGTNPYLLVSSFQVAPIEPGEEFSLHLKVVNSGENDAREVRLTLDGGSLLYPQNTSNVIYLNRLASGEEREITLTMGMNAKDDQAVYRLNAKFDYTDQWNTKFPASEEALSLTATSLGVAEEITDEESTGGIPRVIINKYTLSAPAVLAGNKVTLNLHIENTSLQDVHNVKASLGVIQLEGERGGTVFSPVNSSNSFYLSKIAGRETVVHSIDLFVDPSSAAQTYIVPIKIVYEDKDGKELPAENDFINIPVTQEARLQLVNLELPPQAVLGQPVNIVADFANVGKVPLDNLMVSIEGDFPKENGTYFFGQLAIGASDYFEGTIIPRAGGQLEGNLVFSYLDNNNRQVTQVEPFTIAVQQMSREEMMGAVPEEFRQMRQGGPGSAQAAQAEQASLLRNISSYYFIGVLGIVVGGVFYWRKRRRKKEEDLFNESA